MRPRNTHASASVAALVLAAFALPARAQHDEHAGHSVAPTVDASAAPAVDHAEHVDHQASDSSVAYPPPLTDADRAAAFPDLGDASHTMPENPFTTFVLFDRLEVQDHDGEELASFDLDAWFGRGLQRGWLRSEAERVDGSTEHAELTLLYGRSFARWWEWVAGARQDFEPGPSRTWAAFGLQGLAPYWFDIEATAFIGEGGRTAVRMDTEYELLITNRLILQPLLEIDWYGRADAARGIGSGLSSAAAGLRLRYEIRREIAPYVGVTREKKFGSTADLAREAGRNEDDTRFVVGLRVWF